MLLVDLVETSNAVASTPARNAKLEQLAACLRRLEPDEAAIGAAYLAGQLRQRQIGAGWAALRDLDGQVAPADSPSLTLREVDAAFEAIGQARGPASQRLRREALASLFGRAPAVEQDFLQRLMTGELRQGALEGLLVEALARAIDAPPADVRRACMLRGDFTAVAEVALREGAGALGGFGLEVGRAVQPMLAGSAQSVAEALERTGRAGVEWKLDGARVQVHVLPASESNLPDVRVYTRSLDDVTARVPEIVEMARALPVRSIVLDGEVLALREDGRPYPFQDTASRFSSSLEVERLRAERPLTPFMFDVLHVDGEDLMDHPGAERAAILARVVPEASRVPRIETDDPILGEAFLRDALEHGHEGVLVKSLAAPYEAGRRGTGWIKVKPVYTLDLVVLAAEWGHGRRRGVLSNLHLGARDPQTGEFVMLGKTFKGLTDAVLRWQTERFLEIERARDNWTVYVRPEMVVEIAFDGVQRSPRYPGGVALRFARVVRYRPDKRPEEADTVDAVRAFGPGTD